MTEPLSPETIDALRDIFRQKDVNGTGTLSCSELEECLGVCGLNPTHEELRFLKKHFDSNGDGLLQIEELLANIHVIHSHSMRSTQLMAAFQKFDINKQGFLRLPDLLKILTYNDFMKPDAARKLLRKLSDKYDTNRDGKFNYAEFVVMFYDTEEFVKLTKEAEQDIRVQEDD